MNPKVSIIIPVYGVEKYIERCINSVLRQTYRNLEVIIVDDNTPDRSIEIAQKTINNNKRSIDLVFKYLYHKVNKGQSAARNTAIKEATGDYLYFLDSDDEINENCIRLLVEPLQKRKYDIVCGGYEVIGTDKWKPQTWGGEVFGRDDMIKHFAEGLFGAMTCNKLINMAFLRNNNLYFLEGVLHEDLLWNFQLACMAESFYSINNITYKYYIYPNSSSRSSEKLKKRVDSLQLVFSKMYLFQKDICRYDYLTDAAIRRFIPFYEESVRVLPDFSLKKYYYKLRQTDCRSMKQKLVVYNTFFKKLRYLDYFLPVPVGFAYRYIQWQFVRLKAHRSDIPFVY